MNGSPLVMRLLWAVTATCLVAGVLTAAVRAGGDDDQNAVDVGGTTTTAVGTPGDGTGSTVATDAAGTAVSSSETSPTAPGSATTNPPSPATTRPGSTATTKVGDGPMPPTVPPRSGTYLYKQTTHEEETEDTTEDATLLIEDQGVNGDVRSIRSSMRGSDGTLVDEERWSPTETRVLDTKFQGGLSSDCDWTPDLLERRTDLRKDLTWSADSSCSASFGGTPVVLRMRTNAKVTGSEVMNIGGRQVRVWVIESKLHFTFNNIGDEGTATERFAPEFGLVAASNVRLPDDSYDLVLQSVDPK